MTALRSLIFISLLIPLSGKSLDCAYTDNFCDAIMHEGILLPTLYVVQGKVVSKTPDWLKIDVINIPHGDYSSNMLFIHKDNSYWGLYYSESIYSFQTGLSYLWALGRSANGQFHLLHCSVSSLMIEGNELVGPVAPGINRLPLADLKDVVDCQGLDLAPLSVDIYPTLTSNDV